MITVAAGEPWDPLVAYAVGQGWSGLEALSGIPGLVGATPIQNVGAYGAEVSELITTVRTLDRLTGQRRTLFPGRVRIRLPHLAVQAPVRAGDGPAASWSAP